MNSATILSVMTSGLLALGAVWPASAQDAQPAPAAATPSPAASIGLFVYPAKSQAAAQAKADAVKRGMAACLEGRGYTVK